MWVGIDPSLTGTALAVVYPDGSHQVWRCATEGSQDDSAERVMRRILGIERWLRDRLQGLPDDKPLLVGIEGPSYMSQVGHTFDRGGLWHALYRRVWQSGADAVTVITPTQLKKYATGKGNADKDAVILGVCRRWSSFAGGNDQADALTLAAMIARLDGHPVDGRIPKPCLAALEKLPAVSHG